MARTVFSKQAWYTVNIDDNRSDPEPVKVLMEPLKARDMLELETVAARPGVTQENLLKELMLSHLDVVARRVAKVENYVIDGVPVKDGADLIERGEKAIIDDIYKALTNMSYLSEGSVKN
jgi:hypothetical protein